MVSFVKALETSSKIVKITHKRIERDGDNDPETRDWAYWAEQQCWYRKAGRDSFETRSETVKGGKATFA
jgi:hypothetical protein